MSSDLTSEYRKTLVQFYNDNLHRSFPLVGNTAQSGVPDSLLVNAQFFVSNPQRIFVALSKLILGAGKLILYFSVDKVTGEGQHIQEKDILKSTQITLPARMTQQEQAVNLKFPVFIDQSASVLQKQFLEISGNITIGDTSGLPPSGVLHTYKNVHAACMHKIPEGIQALLVGGKRLTGEITMLPSPGISLEVNPQTKEIIIKSDNVLAATQDDAKEAVIQDIKKELKKVAITTINGVHPSATGDIRITGLDCTSVTPTQYGIQISNPCSKPCCAQTVSAQLSADVRMLQQTEKRLNDYYVSIAASIDAMMSRLAVLISSTTTSTRK